MLISSNSVMWYKIRSLQNPIAWSDVNIIKCWIIISNLVTTFKTHLWRHVNFITCSQLSLISLHALKSNVCNLLYLVSESISNCTMVSGVMLCVRVSNNAPDWKIFLYDILMSNKWFIHFLSCILACLPVNPTKFSFAQN